MRQLRPALVTAACCVALAAPAFCQDGAEAPPQPPKGMVFLPAVDKQPIGMDPDDVEEFLKKELQTTMVEDAARWKKLWEENFLLGTPAFEVRVPDLYFGRYEVTNAQWRVFLDSPRNQRQIPTSGDVRTLGVIAAGLWEIDPEQQAADYQAAWFYLLTRNWDVLKEHVNPEDKPLEGADRWDPREGIKPKEAGKPGTPADRIELPEGLQLEYSLVRPPNYWRGEKLDWWRDGSVPKEELDRPARGISYIEALQFCRWAGYHLPLEVEWERAARGPEGRRFAWGDEWKPTACVYSDYNAALKDAGDGAVGAPIGPNASMQPPHPTAVDSFGEFATPEGVHHLAGNVSEWLLDRLWLYPETEGKSFWRNQLHLARGSNYRDKAETLLASGRIFSAGDHLTPGYKPEGFGVRLAAYPDAARDITLPVALALNDPVGKGVSLWLPTPPGLTEKERRASTRTSKRARLSGVSAERSAGVVTRAAQPANNEHHVYVDGAAKGIALLPAKGYLSSILKNSGSLAKLTEKAAETGEVPFLGVLVATENATIELIDAPGPREEKQGKKKVTIQPGPVSISFGEGEGQDLGPMWAFDWLYPQYYYPVGAMLVLRGDYVAVYAGAPGTRGNADLHLLKDEPLGYLPTKWTSEFVKMKGATGSAEMNGKVAKISVLLPQLDATGNVNGSGARAARVTVEVPVTFSDE